MVMRTTQFIGLTQKCREQVKELTVFSDSGWHTFGMFNEDIPLSIYMDNKGELVAIEYVQACPWSSGPMIFTGLMTPNGPSRWNWKEDESVKEHEYDYVKGLYWV